MEDRTWRHTIIALMYGPRSEYEVADDLVRADDQNEQGPRPGPLPPQGW